MGLIYLDSCICIYAVERASRFHEGVLAALSSYPDTIFAISHLVVAECLVGPLSNNNSSLAYEYECFFDRMVVLDLPEQVYRQMAQIRATTGLKIPDGLHLACARFHKCDSFWTNDNRLDRDGGTFVRALFTTTPHA